MANLLMSDLMTGVVTFFLGLAVVFFGIAILVLVIWVIGKILSIRKKGETKNRQQPAEPAAAPPQSEEGVSAQTVAIITAAICAYYEAKQEKCEFTVKKIIRRN